MNTRRRLLGWAALPLAGTLGGRAIASDAPEAAAAPTAAVALPPYQGRDLSWVELKDREGKPVRLDAPPFANRVRVVNMWATWCGPCLLEMPALDRMRQAFAGRPMDVIAVSVGDSVNQIEQFLSKLPVGLPILLDSTKALARAWQVNGLPETFVFDRAGKLQYRVPGERQWDGPVIKAAIEKLLGS